MIREANLFSNSLARTPFCAGLSATCVTAAGEILAACIPLTPIIRTSQDHACLKLASAVCGCLTAKSDQHDRWLIHPSVTRRHRPVGSRNFSARLKSPSTWAVTPLPLCSTYVPGAMTMKLVVTDVSSLSKAPDRE